MSKYDFAKRLKRMLDNECEITLMETNIARKSAKYYEKMTSLKTSLNMQENELTNLKHEVDKIKRYNERLEEFIRTEEDHLRDKRQNIERLQKEREQIVQQQIVQRKAMLAKMEFISHVKETTQNYFNMDALPHRFQGVTYSSTETSSEWKPFDVDGQQWMQYLEKQWNSRQTNQIKDVDSNKSHSEQNSDTANVTIVI